MVLFLIALAFLAVESVVFAAVVRQLHETGRRALERAAMAEADARAAFEEADDSLVVHSPDGEVLDANRRAGELLGISPPRDGAPPMRLADLSTRPVEMAPVFAEYWRLALGGEAQSFEWEARGRDGVPLRIETTLRAAPWRGGTAILATIRDLAKRGELEKERDSIKSQLFQVQKLDALSRLAGGFAHDFNNALTGIMGSLSVLKTMSGGQEAPDPSAMSGYLDIALDSCTRAGDLVRQLLTLSRHEERKLAEVDLRASLSRIVQICRNSFPKSIQIEYSEFTDGSLSAMGDQAELEQAILNVCINAYHAMTIMRAPGEAEGGHLRIGLRIADPDVRQPGLLPELSLDRRYAVVSIQDTGVGIDAEAQKRLFEPFFTTKDKADGSGLGLSIVYSIMKRHDGSVELRSAPGHGTAVSLYLPLIRARGGAVQGEGGAPLVKGEGRVLVVDDENAVRISAEGMLKICGYEVIVADSGQAGLAAFKERRGEIGLVLLDLSMPGKSGIDVLRELKELDPGVKVVVMSGFVENEGVSQAIGYGALAFLRKPFSMRNLAETVKVALNPP